MRTELPAERLHRRLGGEPSEPDADEAPGEPDGDAALSRWLPAASPGSGPGWLAAVRADPGRAGAIALGVVAAVALLVTVFTLWRDKPPQVVSAKLPPVQMVSSPSATPTASPEVRPDEPVVVSVVGLVHQPGLVKLQPGARIADALDAAGGTLDGADLIGLNMARRLADGEQIVVGITPPPGQPPALGSGVGLGAGSTPAASATVGTGSKTPGSKTPGSKTPGAGADREPVNLNTASVEQLDALPGVGPVTAKAIVAWRDAHGRFTSVDQLGEVDGIGPGRLEKLRHLVRV